MTEEAASSPAFDYPKASIGKRVIAYIVDGLIGLVPALVLFPVLILPMFRYFYRALMYQEALTAPDGGMIAAAVVGVVVSGGWSIFYFLFRDGFGQGQSWGKKMSGLMVVNLDDNSYCSMGKSFVRNIFAWLIVIVGSWVPVLNYFAALVEPVVAMIHHKGHRIGDMVGRTQVIELNVYSPGQPR